MAEDTDVLSQADALMRRHRSFVAQPAQPAQPADEPDTPAAADANATDADIPLLTDVVEISPLAPANTDEAPAALQAEIHRVLSAWLVEALPAAVTTASQHILAELDAEARTSLLPRLQEALAARRNTLAPAVRPDPNQPDPPV
jgi:hypothetical protein